MFHGLKVCFTAESKINNSAHKKHAFQVHEMNITEKRGFKK
jgi:hypothetical protein